MTGVQTCALPISLDEALESEGWARDLVRLVQDERKASGLTIGERGAVTLTVPADRLAWTQSHLALIASETICDVQVVQGTGEASATVTRA